LASGTSELRISTKREENQVASASEALVAAGHLSIMHGKLQDSGAAAKAAAAAAVAGRVNDARDVWGDAQEAKF